MRSHLTTAESLALRSDATSLAHTTQTKLAESAGQLQGIFRRESQTDLPNLDLLWSLAAAIRLCHEAGATILFSLDDLRAAQMLAERQARQFLDISATLSPDSLARLAAQGAATQAQAKLRRDAALPPAQALVTALRETVASIASQASLAGLLLEKGIRGPAYLEEAAEEKTEALLMLAA